MGRLMSPIAISTTRVRTLHSATAQPASFPLCHIAHLKENSFLNTKHPTLPQGHNANARQCPSYKGDA